MTLPVVRFHPSVEADLREIIAYYREIADELPARLRTRLRDRTEFIRRYPAAGAVLMDDCRRVVLTPFPYLVAYWLPDETAIEVLGILPVRRDPAWVAATVRGRVPEQPVSRRPDAGSP